ncbi:MAG: HD domain-containing protein [Candidatus Aenigmarchaeota archaeon]|nr:HD domain-containing protein [Candidatus Aenigmarchaeota archaeon]
MNKSDITNKTVEYVRNLLENESTGHDWWHIYRVWNNAKFIAKNEKADLFVVEIAALLHDIADWKFHDGDDSVGPNMAREWLEKLKSDESIISHVCEIIKEISFKGAGVKSLMKTKEGMIVQDADRLDALGAIGIARAFAYGGHKNRMLYDPKIKPKVHNSKEEYFNSGGTTINHFHEKLLLLKDMMNTETGRKLAEERHKFIEQFLDRFFKEWELKT